MLEKELNFIQTEESECGIVCILHLHYLFFQRNIPKSQIKSFEHVPEKGLNLNSLSFIGRQLGVSISWFKVDYDAFRKRKLKHSIVLIKKKNVFHYVIVNKIKHNTVFFVDPNYTEIQTMSSKDFEKIFRNTVGITRKSNFNLFYINQLSGIQTKNFADVFKQFFNYRVYIVFVFLSSFIVFLLGLFSGLYLQIVLNTIIPNNLTTLLLSVSGIFIFTTIYKNIFDFLMKLYLFKIQSLIEGDFEYFFQQQIFLKTSVFIQNTEPNLYFQRLGNIGELITNELQKRIFVPINLIIGVISVVIIFTINIYLAAVSLFFVVIILLLINLFINKIVTSKKNVLKITNKKRSLLTKVFFNNASIKGKNDSDKIADQHSTILKKYISTVTKDHWINSFFVFNNSLFSGVLSVLIVFLGTVFIIANQFTVGSLFFFTTIFGIFQSSSSQLFNFLVNIKKNKVNLELINDFLNSTTVEFYKGVSEKVNFHKILFKNISYSYEHSKKILNGLNGEITSNLLIQGGNGTGKSTFCKIIAGIHTLQNGELLIDDISISDISHYYLRENILYISSNSIIIENTIFDAIKDFLFTLQETERSFLLSLLQEMKLNLKHDIEWDGSNLSEGQKQFINCLPIFNTKSKILVLDEAFSNISILIVRKIISHLSARGKVIVYATHEKGAEDLFQKQLLL